MPLEISSRYRGYFHYEIIDNIIIELKQTEKKSFGKKIGEVKCSD